ncbi:MAG: Spy/CpxP family protein refolding chaperone [Methylococcales bacterium]|nr:Spy/CpxP family protein refolding chaperone [Methylococcales bacterium]
MNKKMIVLAINLALPLTAFAFTPGDKCLDADHGHRVERLAKDLDLNDAQKTKVDILYKELHEKFNAMINETHTKMQEMLTPGQRTKLEELNMQHERANGL